MGVNLNTVFFTVCAGKKGGAKESLTPISKYLVKEEPPLPPNTQPSTSNPQIAHSGDDANTLPDTSTVRSDETREEKGGSTHQLESIPPKAAAATEQQVEQRGGGGSGEGTRRGRSQPKKREGEDGRGGVKEGSGSSSGRGERRGRRERKVESNRSTDTPAVRWELETVSVNSCSFCLSSLYICCVRSNGLCLTLLCVCVVCSM